VSTLGLEPELFLLTTGTFNLFVKDRIAGRLSGANSVQTSAHECASVCPRNLLKLNVLPLLCQPAVLTGFPPDFHSGELDTSTWLVELLGAIERGFRFHMARPIRRSPKRKSVYLRKDLVEVLAKNAKTLRGSLSPNENPVAGVDFRGF
jgi:hypothetical protein